MIATLINGSTIQSIAPTYKSNNTRGNRSKYRGYFCKFCNCNHWKTLSESYFIKGEWYCKESVDKYLGRID